MPDASQRLRTDVEVQPIEPPPMRVPEKHEVFVSHIEQARLVLLGHGVFRVLLVHAGGLELLEQARHRELELLGELGAVGV